MTGFGPFDAIQDNPARSLALAVDGAFAAGVEIRGAEMPVSYARSVAVTVARIAALSPRAVLGVGVAADRSAAMIERGAGRRVTTQRADIDGVIAPALPPGPERLPSGPVVDLARALDVALSDDAGCYVCNAWLYRMLLEAAVPVVFLHVPMSGYPAERLVQALGQVWGRR